MVETLREIEQTSREPITSMWIECLKAANIQKLIIFIDSFEIFEANAGNYLYAWFWSFCSEIQRIQPTVRFLSSHPTVGKKGLAGQENGG